MKDSGLIKRKLTVNDAYGSVVLICLALGVGSLVIQGLLVLGFFGIANKPAPSLVQLRNGDSIQVEPMAAHERDSEAIKQFVGKVLTLMFAWSGNLPAESVEDVTNPKPDKGVEIEVQKGTQKERHRLPTAAWEASFALEAEFRQTFLQELVKLVPESVFLGNTDVMFVPVLIQEPVKVAEGKWKVGVIGNLLVFEGQNRLGEVISFNKQVMVRSITPPFEQVPQKSHSQTLAQKVLAIRQGGMEIYAIKVFEQDELK